MKKWLTFFLCLTFFILGAVGTYFIMRFPHNKITDKWFSCHWADLKEQQFGTVYEAIGYDIPFPGITRKDFKAKFIDPTTLGYIAEIEVGKLDTTKIPERYQKEAFVEYEDGSWMDRGPIQEVTYEMHMEISLLDKDNFKLCTLTSPAAHISSGHINKYQDLAIEHVGLGIAERVKKIEMGVLFDNCITCEKEG